ncbi:MAG: TlpA family protein disulfide reductase [Myxococcaceae bacterium]|nr:TlpA family protein disulfide reductase [Myxococcaceae bacterium]
MRAALPAAAALLVLALSSCASTARVVALSGEETALEAMRGDVVVVNVWASWCKPCVEEMPLLLDMAEQLAPHGVRFLAVNPAGTDEEVEYLRAFVEKQPGGLARYVYLARGSLFQRLASRRLPTTYVLDRSGRVVDTLVGAERRDGAPSVDRIRLSVMRVLAAEGGVPGE